MGSLPGIGPGGGSGVVPSALERVVYVQTMAQRGVGARSPRPRYHDRVPRLKDHYDEADLGELLAGAPPSTVDEVTITTDGRRLDSAQAVIDFYEELREQRRAKLGA